MVRIVAGLAAALWIACAASAQPTPAAPPQHARARLVSEFASIVPGATNWLGVTFDIDPEWHIYWNGLNDTGFPTTLEVAAPDGYTVGEVRWPAPERHVSDGPLLDHVYEHRVTLLVPVEVPADAKLGSRAEFRVEASWLVCKSACIPGSAPLAITLPIAAGEAKPTPDAHLFKEARSALPQPLPNDNSVTLAWRADGLSIRAANAASLAFCPDNNTAAKFADLVKDGAKKSDTLHLRFDGPADRVAGVLEVNPQSGGSPLVYRIDSRPPGANREPAESSNTAPPGGG